ncbi:MAG TPA: phage portal protein [Gammaproteobacteria bacterium]|nr:phage portal protein [Gammaproteobacteria bacterium]
MGILDHLPFLGRRSMSQAKTTIGGSKQAEWTTWTIQKAVNEGFKVNSWVHRAVHLIAQNASQAPFVVKDLDTGDLMRDHRLSRMLARPHPQFSRKQIQYLEVVWRELAGNGYLKRVQDSGGNTVEVWPVSPDRIAPVPAASAKDGSLVEAYEIVKEDGQKARTNEFTPDNMIHFKLMDPANPIVGIGRLQAAAKAVDLDNSQMGWNLAAMENRGVTDGILSVKDKLDRDSYNAIVERLEERFGGGARNARRPLVVGSDAQFVRMSLTPAEVDFINSRKLGREEIFITFGVPPQLAGVQDSMTYNNFQSALRIMWRSTVLPILDELADTLTSALDDELEDGLAITYDTTGVEALREDEAEKSKVALSYWRMGIPVSQLNQMLNLGVEEFPGWDQPYTGRYALPGGDGSSSSGGGGTSGSRSTDEGTDNPRAQWAAEYGWRLAAPEQRDYQWEQSRRDELAAGPVRAMFEDLLGAQQDAVLAAIDQGQTEIATVVRDHRDEWGSKMQEQARSIAEEFAGTVVVGTGPGGRAFDPRRESRDQLEDTTKQRISAYLDQENAMLQDLGHIEQTTAALVTEQVQQARAEGWNSQQLRQAIEDVGVFSGERALRLSRTLAGTAASIGQAAGAETAGATKKEWMTAADGEVRPEHVHRGGEIVDISGEFSLQIGTVPPRFPLDPRIAPGDRINCRCSMSFY